ncbi:MAG TPA: tail fiber domain-containing protein, partial [Verrucomicrobiae bacterium]
STISGGCANTNAANFSVLGGGYYNDIQRYSDAAVIGGGIGNGIQAAQDAVIAGGWLNVVQNNASAAAIGGGYGNLIQTNAFRATIGGGMGNTNGGRHAVVGGGQENTVIGEAAFIGGGTRNFAFSDSTAIGGGSGNTILINSAYSTIGGGRENKVVGNAGGSTIGGGVYNLINDETTLSTIGGGASNRIGSANSYVTIAGGFNNFNGGLSSTIGGGTDNTISHAAFLATIPGGTENYAGAGYTFAAGRRAQANHTGAFVWADSTDADFASTRDDQFNIRAAGGVFVQSDRGIGLNAADRPLITRGFDLFDASAPPEKQGLGRWGLFMEPFNLVLGIPGDDTPGRNFQVGKYARDGSWIGLMLVDQSGLVQARIFNPTSDRAAKENFTPVNASEVLEKLAALPLSEWNFKQDASAHHLGPVAQDFYAAFGLGTDDKHISTVDADGVALAAIQGLNQKVESENAALRDELRGKEAELEALKARLEALERRFTP